VGAGGVRCWWERRTTKESQESNHHYYRFKDTAKVNLTIGRAVDPSEHCVMAVAVAVLLAVVAGG